MRAGHQGVPHGGLGRGGAGREGGEEVLMFAQEEVDGADLGVRSGCSTKCMRLARRSHHLQEHTRAPPPPARRAKTWYGRGDGVMSLPTEISTTLLLCIDLEVSRIGRSTRPCHRTKPVHVVWLQKRT